MPDITSLNYMELGDLIDEAKELRRSKKVEAKEARAEAQAVLDSTRMRRTKGELAEAAEPKPRKGKKGKRSKKGE